MGRSAPGEPLAVQDARAHGLEEDEGLVQGLCVVVLCRGRIWQAAVLRSGLGPYSPSAPSLSSLNSTRCTLPSTRGLSQVCVCLESASESWTEPDICASFICRHSLPLYILPCTTSLGVAGRLTSSRGCATRGRGVRALVVILADPRGEWAGVAATQGIAGAGPRQPEAADGRVRDVAALAVCRAPLDEDSNEYCAHPAKSTTRVVVGQRVPTFRARVPVWGCIPISAS